MTTTLLRRSARSRKAAVTIVEPHHDDDDSMKEESDEESVEEEEEVKPRPKNPSPKPKTKAAPKPTKARSQKAAKAVNNTTARSTKSSLTGAMQKVLKNHNNNDAAVFPSLLRAVIATKAKDPATVLPSVIHEFWQSHSEADRLPALYQFLIHSIGGGSIASLKLSTERNWDDLTDDDWTDHFDAVVEAMSSQTVPVLLSTASSSHSTEYSKLYQAFWKQLVLYVLTKSRSNTANDNEDEPKNQTTTFQMEWIRQMLSRFMELVHVGVPDVRYALCGAIYATGSALLYYSRDTLRDKLAPAQRQRSAASQNQQKRKSAQLQQQIDGWKRTLKDIEDMAVNFIFTAVFTVRYKDHDPMIRALSLHALSQFCMSRPDLFLQSSYLKYFGWMLSDKVGSVRVAALAGFRQAVATNAEAMTSVLNKFLPRLVECGVRDVDASVQEAAMELLWYLLSATEFFHDVDNEELWVQINRRALDPQTTAAVRKHALYFVWEQLDVPTAAGKPSATSEREAVAQLQSIAQWIAHTLSDGGSASIPIAQLRYDLVDYIVLSLRDMPEYRHLVCNQWHALLHGVRHGEDRPSSRSSQGRGERRMEVVTQRVLIQMLVTAVQLEVWNNPSGQGEDAVTEDGDFIAAHQAAWKESMPSRPRDTKKKSSSTNAKSQEEMTMALLRELPRLLTSFKTETSILQNLTSLPQYFLPSVWSLSSRTKEFEKLCSILSKLMIESTDAVVIGNSCRALAVFANASLHSSDFAFHLLQEFWLVQTSRLEDLLKGALPNEETGQDENSESSIHLCILRLSLLAKVWSVLNGNSADLLVEQLSTAVTSYLATELQSRRLVYHRDDETSSSSVHIPEIWSVRDENVHSVVSRSVSDGLDLLLALIAWRLKQEIQRIDKGENEPGDAENHLVLRLRQRIEQVIGLCYEQYIPREEMDDYSDAHQMFSIHVQEHGIRVSGDIRMLFPRKWLQAKSPFLKAVAIENDSVLAGGSFRFVRSREWLMKDNRDDNAQAKASNEQELMFQLLLPLARALGINWENGSRKEAGAALVHLIGSGKETSEMVLCMSRVLKKMCPVRFLEAQMAFLRERFEIWADGEPEEPGDRPTEQEMQEFEEQERLHQQKFDVLVQFAAKFSATLGVGKIRDTIMNRALSGFVREGIRFAFSTDVKGSDEPLSAGVRLPFLTILQKYLTWIRSNKDARNNLMNELNQQEMELRSDPQYGEVFEEDLNALLDFRKVGELGDYPLNGDGDTFVTSKISGSKITSTKGLKPRTSMGSSVSSIHSKASASLNSIQEDVAMDTDEENESHESPSPQKRPRLSSARSQASVATSKGPSFEDDTDDGSSPQKRPRSSSARSQASVATSRGPSFDDDSDDGSDTGGSSSI